MKGYPRNFAQCLWDAVRGARTFTFQFDGNDQQAAAFARKLAMTVKNCNHEMKVKIGGMNAPVGCPEQEMP